MFYEDYIMFRKMDKAIKLKEKLRELILEFQEILTSEAAHYEGAIARQTLTTAEVLKRSLAQKEGGTLTKTQSSSTYVVESPISSSEKDPLDITAKFVKAQEHQMPKEDNIAEHEMGTGKNTGFKDKYQRTDSMATRGRHEGFRLQSKSTHESVEEDATNAGLLAEKIQLEQEIAQLREKRDREMYLNTKALKGVAEDLSLLVTEIENLRDKKESLKAETDNLQQTIISQREELEQVQSVVHQEKEKQEKLKFAKAEPTIRVRPAQEEKLNMKDVMRRIGNRFSG